jgi:hypothetical protein
MTPRFLQQVLWTGSGKRGFGSQPRFSILHGEQERYALACKLSHPFG